MAIEEKVIAAIAAMAIAGNSAGQVITLSGLFRRGQVRAGPNIQIVEPGQDIQVISVPDHGPPLSCRVVSHVNTLGRRLNMVELGWPLHLVSPIPGRETRIFHIPGVHDVIHGLLCIAVTVLPDSAAREGRTLIYSHLPVVLNAPVFAAQIRNEYEYPFDLVVQSPGDKTFVVQGVRSHGDAKLFEAAQAVNGPGLLAYPLQSRHQYTHQQRNNGYHNQ